MASIGFNYLHVPTPLGSWPTAGRHRPGGHLDVWLNADSDSRGLGGLEIQYF